VWAYLNLAVDPLTGGLWWECTPNMKAVSISSALASWQEDIGTLVWNGAPGHKGEDYEDDHHARLAYVNRRNEHLPFPAMKRALAALGAEDADDRNDAPRLAPRPPYRPALDRLGAWLDALNAPPALLAGWAMGRVADPAFAASLKFAAGMLVLPLWWLLLFALGALAAGPLAGAGLALAAVATLFARRACIRHADPPHRVRG
jgi:hypothetical protein